MLYQKCVRFEDHIGNIRVTRFWVKVQYKHNSIISAQIKTDSSHIFQIIPIKHDMCYHCVNAILKSIQI